MRHNFYHIEFYEFLEWSFQFLRSIILFQNVNWLKAFFRKVDVGVNMNETTISLAWMRRNDLKKMNNVIGSS